MGDILKEIEVDADDSMLDEVLEFLEQNLEETDCSPKVKMQICVAAEEIFVNIAHYAYNPDKGRATVRVELTGNPVTVTITFMDNGVPFDPLAKEDPGDDIISDEDKIGGLGIFMTKKMMDDVTYEYKEGKNILKMKKTL
ncbi:MAG: ATP-binding protein [Lachnospiraceae bacterium]|nr:ATP-binding protein [Lachnospiraceae bacterium]